MSEADDSNVRTREAIEHEFHGSMFRPTEKFVTEPYPTRLEKFLGGQENVNGVVYRMKTHTQF